jgi:amino acid transporter
MTAAGEAHLRRRLGLGLLTLYGIGVMVGAGIYVLVGAVAGEAGAAAPLSFLLAGLVAAPTALSYAELAGRVPQAAGEAAYLRAATGRVSVAAAAGLTLAVVAVVSAGAVLKGGVGYLQALLPLPEAALAAGVGAALGLAALVGILESLSLAALFTGVEVLGLAIIVWVGWAAEPAAGAALLPEAGAIGIAGGAVLAFFAFLGFEDMVNMVEETTDPGRTMPRAILLALAITTALYVAVAWAAVRAVPAEALAASPRPLALVYESATGHPPAVFAAIATVAALNGVLGALVLAARVLFGLGRIWPAMAVFHEAHARFGTPVRATALAAVATVALALSAPVALLAEVSATILLAMFVAVNWALIRLKRRAPAPLGAFEAPAWVPLAGLALSALAILWGVAA